jgi:hypothetical protein
MVLAWTSVTSMATARIALGGAGTTSAGLAFGGIFWRTYTAATEEWLGAGSPTTVTITAS